MTSQEQAKATAYAKQLLHELNIGDCVAQATRAEDLAITVRHFAQALDAARRDTWEAAAKMIEKQFVYHTDDDDELSWSAIDKDDLLEELRQQAAAQADKES